MALWDSIITFVSNPLFIISIIFWIIAFILTKIIRKKNPNAITLFFPFYAMLRTRRLNKFFELLARRGRRIWRLIWNIGVVISFGLMIYAIYFFISNLVELIVNPQVENAIVPLIPGVTINFTVFSYFILPLLVVLTVHEFAHAIAAEIDDVKIKSSGIIGGGIFFVVLYGGFVELDEFQLDSRKISSITRLRVASAGIWSNVTLALIMLILSTNFVALMQIGYIAEVFNVDSVIPSTDGGFNEGNIFKGDIVLAINGTSVDFNSGRDLSSILDNKTSLQCSVGDQLVFTVLENPQGEQKTRILTLGFRSFVGFEYSAYNNTAFQIGEVYSALSGGNNEDTILSGAIITHIDNIPVNYSSPTGKLETYLKLRVPNYQINLTATTGITYTIDVNYYPNVAAAHYLNNVFMGLGFEKLDNNSIQITKVLDANTEGGINEGVISEGTIITHINGTVIDLTHQSIKHFIRNYIDPHPGDTLVFTSSDDINYTLQTTAIPVISVYLGIIPKSYWLPSNFIGQLFGPNFPNWLEIEFIFTWIVSFSVALFNLLPVGIFDGGRMFKELLHLIIGTKYNNNVRKKLRYEFDPKERRQHLMTQNVSRVIGVNEVNPNENPALDSKTVTFSKWNPSQQIETGFHSRSLNFTPIDTANTGFFDTVEIHASDLPVKKTILEIEFECDEDEKLPSKRKISIILSLIIGGIIAANFIISISKFGTGLFWI